MERYQRKTCKLCVCFQIDSDDPSDDVCFTLFRIHSVGACYVGSAIGNSTEKQGLEMIRELVVFPMDHDADGLNSTILIHPSLPKKVMLQLMIVLSTRRKQGQMRMHFPTTLISVMTAVTEIM